MICSACGHESEPSAKFCSECGARFTASCRSCGTAVTEQAKFCSECGASTQPSRSPEPTAIETASEKKHITVLFADVAGSMDLQERLDAEVWAEIMGRFVSILAEGVRRFGGTVDKFTGDGIMALFGAPVAQEDHARRACHAAWHLTKAIGAYSEDLRRTHDVELRVRLGLNSGEVVVGRVGDDVTLDPTALGHTVGLAQRMEAIAEPGSTYLTEHTARLVEGWFHVEDLGARPVKGSAEPLCVHILGGPMSSPARRTVGAAPLVGRRRELAVLADALDMASEGQFQVVGLVGEAGVGKTRLCDEFARSAEAHGVTVRRTAGVSHATDVPLVPILSFLRDYFGIREGDTPSDARDKITDRLLALDPDFEDSLPLFYDFLEVPDPQRAAPQLAPDVRMDRLFTTIRRITARRSERQVLMLLAEDLHWFDPQSVAFLERLIESLPGSRTLVVTNFRPEFSARWSRHSYYRQVPLRPLPNSAIGELLARVVGDDPSLRPLGAFIQERTGGNPFFVEELVRALVEDGTLVGVPGRYRLTRPLHEANVPSTVQAVLAARIDRLSPELKATLQTAAVIGQEFDRIVLGEVTGSADAVLNEALTELCGAELLQENTESKAAGEYRFWHPLTREVAYGSLLTDRRRRLHGAVAQALVRQNGDRLDELAAVLAWHWEQAGRPEESARWSVRAGTWALRHDLHEAGQRWRKAVLLLESCDETDAILELKVRARSRILQFGARTGIDLDEAEREYRAGRAEAERLGDIRVLAVLVAVAGSPNFWAGDLRGGVARYLEAARLAETAGDEELQAVLYMPPSTTQVYTGPVAEGLDWARRAIAASRGDPERGAALSGYSPLNRARVARARLLMYGGGLAEAVSEAETGIDACRRRSEPELLAWNLSVLPEAAWLAGEHNDLRDAAAEAVELGEQTGDVGSLVMGLRALAIAHLTMGEAEESAGAATRAIAEAQRRRSGLFEEAPLLVQMARAQLALGQLDASRVAADAAVAVARRQGAAVVECSALLTRALGRRAGGVRSPDSAADLVKALAIVRATGAVTYEPFVREELARLQDGGDLVPALELYRQIGATGHARRLETELRMRVPPS